MVIAAEHAEFERSDDESKLKLFFEHFVNVFPKKSLWNERDLKAGAKYGLTTIKPLLTKEAKVAQIFATYWSWSWSTQLPSSSRICRIKPEIALSSLTTGVES
jgi:hypothetical protein